MRKHLTKAEKTARESTQSAQRRNSRVTLRMPDWLSPEAVEVWKNLKRKLKDIDLLDNTDADLLAVYCDAYAHYQAASAVLVKARTVKSMLTKDDITACQSWARLLSSLGEKLGLTPTGKARLARKKAKVQEPDELEQLLDDVEDYVNEPGDEK